MLDRASLEVFLALAHHRHFGRAADSLGIAQSVASKRLAQLETLLGARLVDRGNRRRIELTREGALFLIEARTALAALQAAERAGLALARGTTGPLRIGYVFSAAMSGVLPAMIRSLRRSLPGLDLQPLLMETPSQLKALSEAHIDIAVTRRRPSWPERVRVVGYHREPLLIAIGDAMPLARRASLCPADLVAETFLTPQFHEQVGLADTVRDLARAAGLPEPRIRPTDNFITAACLAAAGEGIILAPASLQNLRIDGLSFLPIENYSAALDLVVLAREAIPAVVIDTLCAAFGAQPAHSSLATSRESDRSSQTHL